MNLVRTPLAIGEHVLQCRVAGTPEQRALGLMHRRELAPDEAMLFVCDEVAVQSFWMKDTPVALSIAFLDDDGTILHLDDMDPHCLDGCSSRHPVRYVLEVPQGWFRDRGIGTGERVRGPMFLATA